MCNQIKKRILALFLATVCSLTFIIPAAATSEASSHSSEFVWHDISELGTLPYDETYSYDEMFCILSDEGYSDNEIIEMLGTNTLNSRSGSDVEIRYAQFKMGENTFDNVYILEARFSVGLEYRGNNYMPDRIVSLGGAHVYTGAGADCVFTGDLYYELINGQSFYYNFYGDLYRAGTVSWEFGASVVIGEFFNIHGSISNGSGFIENVDVYDTYCSAALNP